MIDGIDKIFNLLEKFLGLAFGYFRKPRMILTITGSGCRHGPGHISGTVYFRWHRDLVLHNDSAYLIRGIKLLKSLPKPWVMSKQIPTRLEPDQKVTIPIQAEIREDNQKLIDRYGADMQQKFLNDIFPAFVANTLLEFEMQNQHGRTFYQYSAISQDGSVKTEITSKRRANGN
jgi:hypothetical protein